MIRTLLTRELKRTKPKYWKSLIRSINEKCTTNNLRLNLTRKRLELDFYYTGNDRALVYITILGGFKPRVCFGIYIYENERISSMTGGNLQKVTEYLAQKHKWARRNEKTKEV